MIAFLAGQGQGSSSSSVMTSSLSSAMPSPFASSYLTSATSTTNSATPATSTPGGAAPPLGVVMDTAKILVSRERWRKESGTKTRWGGVVIHTVLAVS